ncbi:MAG: tyrosine-type recombinase/integrase [Betaproteobacteria bacterium]|nr:tyrosine-type recombinase/integrase [Betaproteobacteria bacterium]
MARRGIHRLSPLFVTKTKEPGRHADGGNLYLVVEKQPAGHVTKSWSFMYERAGKQTEIGLGSVNAITLDRARDKAFEFRALLAERIDPLQTKRERENKLAVSAAKGMTFDACASAYIDAHKPGWRNPKHAEQWTATLNTYASPVFGSLPVAAVDTGLVMKVLEPIWYTKTETATRLRGRIENVLGWATVRGYRSGDNPARWRGHLDKLLPMRSKVQKVKHHAAMPYAELPAFMAQLRTREGVAPSALQFIILTAARVSEAVNAQWGEIDFEARVWTVPAERMKAGREHRVPLTKEAGAVLKRLQDKKQSDYIFPGWKIGQPLTGAACLELLDEMGHAELTTHGFRSTFRDWCAEQTNFPRELAEAALAHALKDKVEAAYQRGDLLERRRKLMEAWAAYCNKLPGDVVQLHGGRRTA